MFDPEQEEKCTIKTTFWKTQNKIGWRFLCFWFTPVIYDAVSSLGTLRLISRSTYRCGGVQGSKRCGFAVSGCSACRLWGVLLLCLWVCRLAGARVWLRVIHGVSGASDAVNVAEIPMWKFSQSSVLHLFPAYICSMWSSSVDCIVLSSQVIGARNTRSSTTPQLFLSFTRTNFARRGYCYSAPTVWNCLPKTPLKVTLPVFKSRLKTLLFGTAFTYCLSWRQRLWSYDHLALYKLDYHYCLYYYFISIVSLVTRFGLCAWRTVIAA